jgi:hypothetical protein
MRQRGGMTLEELDEMRGCCRVTHPKIAAKAVKVTCDDGDILEGFIELISDEDRDVVFLLQSSSNPAKYKLETSYRLHWEDIAEFQVLT